MLSVALIEPEIPQNTGNIARTCAAAGIKLHLVGPLGFDLSDKHLKRAGLDYWHLLDIEYSQNFAELAEKCGEARFYFFSTKAARRYDEADYSRPAVLVFGKETAGLPEQLLEKNYENCLRIPMIEGARSLNLSNSVAIAAYEALRQGGFDSMSASGKLTKDL